MDPPFVANDPTNFARFWYVVSGKNLTGTLFAFGPAEMPDRLAFYWAHLLDNLHRGVLVAALVGCVALSIWDRPAAVLLGFLFFGWAIYSIENDIPDIEVYFIPTYLVLALAASVGLGLALAEAEHFLGRFPRISRRVAPGVLSVCSRSRWLGCRYWVSRTPTRGTTEAMSTGDVRSSWTWPRTPHQTPQSCITGASCGTWYWSRNGGRISR